MPALSPQQSLARAMALDPTGFGLQRFLIEANRAPPPASNLWDTNLGVLGNTLTLPYNSPFGTFSNPFLNQAENLTTPTANQSKALALPSPLSSQFTSGLPNSLTSQIANPGNSLGALANITQLQDWTNALDNLRKAAANLAAQQAAMTNSAAILASAGKMAPPEPQHDSDLRSQFTGSLMTGSVMTSLTGTSDRDAEGKRLIPCQVSTCNIVMDINAKDYCRRHRSCEEHIKAMSVLHQGSLQRFCQQCSRFHVLLDFDGDKRSCRSRLTSHNHRRRSHRRARQAERLGILHLIAKRQAGKSNASNASDATPSTGTEVTNTKRNPTPSQKIEPLITPASTAKST